MPVPLASLLSLNRLAALGTLAIAGGVAVGSGANFTSASANPANVFTTGSLTHVNSKDGAAILTAAGMTPGGPAAVGTVDIHNTGSVAGTFSVTRSTLTDSSSGTPLSAKLQLVVKDCGTFAGSTPPDCTGGSQVYSGTIAGMATQALGSYAAGAQHRYEFRVTFPDGGPAGADNAYQSASTTAKFDFSAVS